MKKIENISFSYDGKPVLSSFSAEFPDKGIFAVTGVSGSGKSTLLRLICGLEKPDSGRITGFERDTFSIAFQTPRLIEWLSAEENIAAVLSGRHSERVKTAQKILSQLEMDEFKQKRPCELSGGQQQRVSLGRALAKESTVLLLDEPTTGLDGELAARVMDIIRKESEKRLVIYATHGEKEKSYAKKIIQV